MHELLTLLYKRKWRTSLVQYTVNIQMRKTRHSETLGTETNLSYTQQFNILRRISP